MGSLLVVMVTALDCCPVLPEELNSISTSPFAPGAMASLVYFLPVHPQVGFTLTMYKGFFPVLVTMKVCFTLSPSLMFPKSKDSLSHCKVVAG